MGVAKSPKIGEGASRAHARKRSKVESVKEVYERCKAESVGPKLLSWKELDGSSEADGRDRGKGRREISGAAPGRTGSALKLSEERGIGGGRILGIGHEGIRIEGAIPAKKSVASS